ncbi:hypothetical protein KC319_g2009 [Hortaea werneckii]|nr:hypothetical protein KC319_g2009 [Hortaea werneckii]
MTRTNVPSSSGYVSRRVQNGTPSQNPEPNQQNTKNGKSNGSKGRNDGNKNSEKRKIPINQKPTARGKEVIRLSTWRAVEQSPPVASSAKESPPVDDGGDVAVKKSQSEKKESFSREAAKRSSDEYPTVAKAGPVEPTKRDGSAIVSASTSNPPPQQEGSHGVEDCGDVAVKKSHSDGKEPLSDKTTAESSSERLTAAKDEPVEPVQQDEQHQSDPRREEQDTLPQQHTETSPPTPSNRPSPSSSSSSTSPPTPIPYPSSETLWKTTQPFIPTLPTSLRRGRIPLNKSLLVQLAENPSSCPLFHDPTTSETGTMSQGGSTQDEDEDEWEGHENGYLLNPLDVMTLGHPPTELSTSLFTPYIPPVPAREDLWLAGLGMGGPGAPAVLGSSGWDGERMRRVVGGGVGVDGVLGKVKLEGWGMVERKEVGFEREAVKVLWSVPNWEGGEWSWEALGWGFGTAWGWGWEWWY